MEANQKKKFVCSYCNKRYPCGKSLGGHIRIHLNGNNHHHDDLKKKKKDYDQEEGYILRENPKKNKKFEVDPNKNNNSAGLLKVCKECGKGFQSLKALCGHMACHSRNYYSYDSDASDKVMDDDDDDDDQSDNETSSAPSKRRRSKRMVRYKNTSFLSGNGSGGSFSSSMASDLEQEQEEVALCLMMLSKDSGLKGCLSFVADSSDNNSIVLEEAKPSCFTKMRIRVKNSNSSCYDDGDDDDDDENFMEMKVARKKQHQQRQVVMSSDGYDSENSDSDYFNYGPKKGESEVSDEVVKKVEMRSSGFGDSFNDEKGKRIREARDGYDSRKRARDDSPIGRRIQHQKKARDDTHESGENSFETAIPSKKKMVKTWSNGKKNNPPAKANALSKKAKTHECPFCSKVFRSGQALGGHKRSHFVGASEDGNARTLVIKSSAGMIDLNLPAPVDEEQGNSNRFVTWEL
ncbi:Zinc finger protein ZAT1 [Linum perenne]